jgi:hypothetical protein
MFEFFQVVWDLFMLRRAARNGQLTIGVWVFAISFVVLLHAIALPAVMLYQNHSQMKPLFIAAMVLDGIVFIVGIIWAWNLHKKLVASRAGGSTTSGK